MEIPHLGQQCDHPHCKQLDFLPFICKCNKTFCSDHFREHIQDCSEHPKSREVEAKKLDDLYKCSHVGCKETSIVPLICDKCKQHFCITHRHIIECYVEDPSVKAAALQKMMVPVQQFQEAKLAVDKQIDNNISNMKKKNKNMEMANRLQLMRVKNKATGLKSIPTTDRIYFNIRLPEKYGDKSGAVFVSKTWTVGRAIDAIAAEVKVQNKNNVSGEQKLRLFDGESKRIITECVSTTLSDLVVNNNLIDGQNLILEYVVDDCKELHL